VAYLTEEIDPAHAARAAGTFVAGTTIGGLAGRLLSSPVAEIAGWRIGVFTVAVLCGIASLGFVKLAPQPRGFIPSNRSGANPEGSLAHRLLANLRSRRQLTLFAQAFLLMGGFVALYNYLGFRLSGAPFYLPPFAVSLVLAYLAGTWASSRAGAEASRFGRAGIADVGYGDDRRRRYYVERQRHRCPGRSGDRHCRGSSAHTLIAAGWTGRSAPVGKAQASSLYNLFYYGGSSVIVVRRAGLRRVWLDRRGGDDHGARRHRGRRGSGVLPAD
jgi:MFS family permease